MGRSVHVTSSVLRLACAALLLISGAPSFAGERIALVIGNSRYTGIAPLKNPSNDAKAVGKALKELGFKVNTVNDGDRNAMISALRNFGRESNRKDVDITFFYYAGHGVQSAARRNYLIPVNARVKSDEDLGFEAVSLDDHLMRQVDGNGKANIVVLDACRDNPFSYESATRNAKSGWADIEKASGTLIAYATAPGSVASDGDKENGLYTGYLIQALRTPGIDIESALDEVGRQVAKASGNKQRPRKDDGLYGKVVLLPDAGDRPLPALAGTSPAAPPNDAAAGASRSVDPATGTTAGPATGLSPELLAERELAFWEAVEDSRDMRDYEDFLAQFPKGPFSGIARRRLEALRGATAKPAAPVVVASLDRDAANPIAQVLPANGAIKDCAECPDILTVAAGSFTMGAPGVSKETLANEGPARKVDIRRGFGLSRSEVTVGQFRAFVEDSGHQPAQGCRSHVLRNGDILWETVADRNWANPGFAQTDDHPVVCIAWADAVAYAEWLSRKTGQTYRLPTEAEWEYAARAESQKASYWASFRETGGLNDFIDNMSACGHANVRDRKTRGPELGNTNWSAFGCDDGAVFTTPVGRYKPNAFGFVDMLGNVREWTAHCYSATAPDDATPASPGTCDSVAVRGGAWNNKESDVRFTRRWEEPASVASSQIGMRVLREAR
jgi:formylglycine-generating enzyme required for sulfatase activity